MRKVLWCLLLAAFGLTPGQAQPKPDVIQQLLDLPAPRPTPPPPPKAPSLAGFDARNMPPDDAPIELLEAYWSLGGPHPAKTNMSAKVRERFLAHAEQQPDKLVFFLEQEWLPDTPDIPARVRAIREAGLTTYYGQTEEQKVRRHEEIWRVKLREWLLLHSPFYVDELEEKARGVKDENGEIIAEKHLRALAIQAWERAQPLLEGYAYSPQLRTAALAVSLLYERAVTSGSTDAEKLRTRLQEIVADQQMPGRARSLASQSLMQTKWEGRDEWFLSLFADDSLRVLEDGASGTLYPLNKPVRSDPEHWLPLLAKLVGQSNSALHEAAVDCLASIDPDSPHKEALQLLLPWLANPTWSAAEGRKELVQSLAKVKLPDAVPGLLWMIENDEDEELQMLAVAALAAYQEPRAIASLKRFLARVTGPRERAAVIEALVACGGLSDDEIARAIESYATRLALTGKGDLAAQIGRLDEFDDNLPLQLAVGKVLSETDKPREAVATRLLDRIARLERAQPALARLLLTVVQKWNLRGVDASIVERIAAHKADLQELQYALQIRDRLRQSVRDELQSVAVRRDAAAGIAAAILADENLFYKILGETDNEPKRALLAAARLTRTPLPLAQVGELLDDAGLKLAAERYLISEDSAEARMLVLARHPNEALILGAKAEADGKPTSGAELFAGWEEKLRAEVLAQGGADEIVALLSPRTVFRTTTQTIPMGIISTAHIAPLQLVIRARKDNAELVWRRDEVREKVRTLTAAEWQDLREFLADKKIDGLLPPGSAVGATRSEYEFLRLTKHGGRRLHIANVEESAGNQDPYSLLLRKFRSLTESREFQVRYDLRGKGLEIVLADEKSPVSRLCGDGNNLFVQIVAQPMVTIYGQDRLEMIASAAEWYEINAGQLGAKVEPPKTCTLAATASFNSEMNALFGNYVVRSGQGIVRTPPLPQSEVIVAGEYQDVLESPDGKWLLALKGAAGPQTLVRIELATRQETAVPFAVTGRLKLFAAIPGVNKFVFMQQHNDNESQGYILTPTTGVIERIQGNAGPLSRRPQRNFQPTGKPDEVWAAMPNPHLRVTEIGRYNLKTFAFTKFTAIPELHFTSDALWVDEAINAIYIVYRGDLLRFPLRP